MLIAKERTPVLTLVIDQELASYLQMLQYEANGYNVMINHATRAQIMPNERYELLLKEGRDAHTAFQLAFDEVCSMYVPDEYLSGDYVKQINYLTRDLKIYLATEEEKNIAGCSCCESK